MSTDAKPHPRQEQDKVIAALVKARGAITPVEKTGENKYDKYSYATLEDYVRAISKPLASNELTLTFDVLGVDPLEPRTTKGGGQEYGCRVTMRGTLLHVSGQSISACGMGDGYDRGDKAIYKAQTGARKYLMAAMLNLATTDDPEEDSPQGEPRRDEKRQDDRREERRDREERPREREPEREERRREPEPEREERRREPEPREEKREARREPEPDAWSDVEDEDLRAAAKSFVERIVRTERELGTRTRSGNEITGSMVLKSASRADDKAIEKLDDFFVYTMTDEAKHGRMMRWLRATCRRLEEMAEEAAGRAVKAGKSMPAVEGSEDDGLPF